MKFDQDLQRHLQERKKKEKEWTDRRLAGYTPQHSTTEKTLPLRPVSGISIAHLQILSAVALQAASSKATASALNTKASSRTPPIIMPHANTAHHMPVSHVVTNAAHKAVDKEMKVAQKNIPPASRPQVLPIKRKQLPVPANDHLSTHIASASPALDPLLEQRQILRSPPIPVQHGAVTAVEHKQRPLPIQHPSALVPGRRAPAFKISEVPRISTEVLGFTPHVAGFRATLPVAMRPMDEPKAAQPLRTPRITTLNFGDQTRLLDGEDLAKHMTVSKDEVSKIKGEMPVAATIVRGDLRKLLEND